jgi:hypothetical protein
MIWQYDACGTYADYKGYTIIDQQHPKLIRFEITKEDSMGELIHIGLASTISEAKKIINGTHSKNDS